MGDVIDIKRKVQTKRELEKIKIEEKKIEEAKLWELSDDCIEELADEMLEALETVERPLGYLFALFEDEETYVVVTDAKRLTGLDDSEKLIDFVMDKLERHREQD